MSTDKNLEKAIDNAITRGLIGLLGVVFVTLKLTGVIDWSWWWVTLPFWGGIALVLGLLVLAFILALLSVGAGKTGEAIREITRKIRRKRRV